jgi:hypothetical protein
MPMKKALRFLFTCMVAIAAVSCASAPKTGSGGTKAPDAVSTARKAAEDSRTKALEIKADVASKVLFEQADAAFNEAKTLETAPDLKTAAEKYTEASGLFANAYDDASKKKEAAQKSLDSAALERKASEDTLAAAEQEKLTAEKGK